MRFSAIAHATHQFCNPLGEAQISSVLDRLDLAPRHGIVDFGCGKAELLVGLVDRFGCVGTGIDINEDFLRAAAKRVKASRYPTRIKLLRGRAKEIIGLASQYDLSVCVGSCQAFGLYRDAIIALARMTRFEGLILVGAGYWRRRPDQAYLDFLETNEAEMLTDSGNIEAARKAGLVLLYSCVSDERDWDAYEESYYRNVVQYIDANPMNPDRDAMLERILSWNQNYHRYGRQTLGFGLYLFKKPMLPDRPSSTDF